MRLQNKTIIITGSTTGIGKAIAKYCLDEGAQVLIHGLEADLAEQTQQELDPGKNKTAVLIQDLTESAAVDNIIQCTLDAFGKIDALVNNAAAVGTGNIHDTDEEKFDRYMSINTRAPFFLIQAIIPHLEKTKGNIVNIGSVNAYCGEPELLPYSMAKGAMQTMTRNLGDTLHRENGIRVNQINPGWILTENEQVRKQEQGMPADWPADLPAIFAPSKRIFDAAEIASAAVYFLSDEAGPVSGSVLDIEQYPMIGRNLAKC
ncbi:MAG: SDR family oxidoreductase [Verrucomicrobiales bacterium]|nr:SDR family oxidoreductase [Verrucomicrobiales bacterium]